MELRVSLKPEMFDGGPALAGLYDYLHVQLVQANVKRDASITAGCQVLADQLGDTWREAAMASAVGA